MPSHKSAEKAVRKTARRTAINKSRVNRIRTFMKRAESMVSLLGKDVSVTQDVVMKAIVDAESEVMRGATHGVFHKNTASRKISRLVQKAKKAMQA